MIEASLRGARSATKQSRSGRPLIYLIEIASSASGLLAMTKTTEK
jgi:hypothetical protein